MVPSLSPTDFGAMPCRSGSHWRPGHVVTVTPLDRAGPSTRDLLNTLAAITCNEADFRCLGDAWADAVAPSGNGVGSEIDAGHYKSFSGPRFRLGERPRAPSESPYVRIWRQRLTKPSDQPA